MPLYEYVCTDCQHHVEAIRSMKDADSPIRCDHCNSQNTRRKISSFYAQSSGRELTHSSHGCGNCSGGSCGSCGH